MPSLVNARPLLSAEAVRAIPTLIYLFASMVNPLKVRVDEVAELVPEGGSISCTVVHVTPSEDFCR